jgi:hypothetical protein
MSGPYLAAPVIYQGRHAAIITRIHDETWVNLQIFEDGGRTYFISNAERGVTWEFPPGHGAPEVNRYGGLFGG